MTTVYLLVHVCQVLMIIIMIIKLIIIIIIIIIILILKNKEPPVSSEKQQIMPKDVKSESMEKSLAKKLKDMQNISPMEYGSMEDFKVKLQQILSSADGIQRRQFVHHLDSQYGGTDDSIQGIINNYILPPEGIGDECMVVIIIFHQM